MPSLPPPTIFLNEKRLLKQLRNEQMTITPNMMRALGGFVLLACHDRRVTHEFFASVVDTFNDLQCDIAGLERAGALRHSLLTLEPEREPVVLDAQIVEVMRLFMLHRRRLADKLEEVMECPEEGDTVS